MLVTAEHLMELSGYRTPSSVRRWASSQGIRTLEGKAGPWTTVDALNAALGVRRQGLRDIYSPEFVLGPDDIL